MFNKKIWSFPSLKGLLHKNKIIKPNKKKSLKKITIMYINVKQEHDSKKKNK